MKVFVTGATGYIGRPVAAAFRRAGYEVLGLARSAEKARLLAAREIRPVLGALEETEILEAAAFECDVVVHAAADPGSGMFTLDRKALQALLDGSSRRGARASTVLYTSGTWIYGDTGGVRVDETAGVHPPEYARLRPENERRVLEAGGLVLRPGCVYGRQGSLTSMWFEGAAAGDLEIVGSGSTRWALVHQDDLADAYVRAAESGRSGEIFNVADRSESSVAEMARGVARVTAYTGVIRSLAVPEAIQKLGSFAECLAYDQRLDSGKAERLLGWRPKHEGFLEAVETYFASWKAGSA